MYLYGKNSVLERIKNNPKSIKKLFLLEDFNDWQILDAMHKARLRSKRLTGRQFEKIKRAQHLQGIIAEVENFIYTTFEELLENCLKKQIVIIFLDNLTDPQNLGSIIRTTACMGGFAIAIPKHDSCKITDTVLHVASGGENYTPLTVVGNTAKTLAEAKRSGCWIAGSILKGGTNIEAAELAFPLCLVMGSEGRGIREGLIKHLDFKITLPMKGAHLSFNVAVATALFSYEISRQREERTRS